MDGACEAKAPKAGKCANCLTNSFASHLWFWLVVELLPRGNKKKSSCSCFVHGKYFVLDLWPTAKPTVFAICTSPMIQLFCSPKLCRTFVLFLLPITVVPREIKDNAYAHFWGANKVYYGWCQKGEPLKVKDYLSKLTNNIKNFGVTPDWSLALKLRKKHIWQKQTRQCYIMLTLSLDAIMLATNLYIVLHNLKMLLRTWHQPILTCVAGAKEGSGEKSTKEK